MSEHNYVVMDGELHRIIGEAAIKGVHYYITNEESELVFVEQHNAKLAVDEIPLGEEPGLPTRAVLFRVEEVQVFRLVAVD